MADVVRLVVVGFHHKRGWAVEWSWPTALPPEWRALATLALPDGAHRSGSDTVLLHIPSDEGTLFGVSCFRQVAQDGEPRGCVQKSVVAVARRPLFGLVAVKLQLVARAWFRQGDFADTTLLRDAFDNLNACPVTDDRLFEGLSTINLLETWRQKTVLLFKLLLLQRKVVLHGTPAGPVSYSLMSLLSLFPECIKSGLSESANVILARPMSPSPSEPEKPLPTFDKLAEDESAQQSTEIDQKSTINILDDAAVLPSDDRTDFSLDNGNIDVMTVREKCHSVGEKYKAARPLSESQSTPSMVRDMSVNGLTNLAASVDYNECGMPLKLFSERYLCLPYLSLQYMDLLSDPNVKGFLIGASNVLFKQKRQLFDILVDLNDFRIETGDMTLRRQLQLTTEDLRFADHLVRHGPLQGDEWVRDQFAGYLLCLLRTCSLPEGSREFDHFNSYFIGALKETEVYKQWEEATDKEVTEIFINMPPGHPFAGQLSVQDMKLRLAHTMSSTESGRKVTQAVMNTSRAVVSTSKVVGGALSQAKGAFSVWWSTLTTPSPQAENAPSGDADFEVVEALPGVDAANDSKDKEVEDKNSEKSVETAEEIKESDDDLLFKKYSDLDINSCDIPNELKKCA